MIDLTLPGFSYEVVAYKTLPDAEHVSCGEGVIENRWYRVRIDPQTGGLRSWYDKELNRELVNQEDMWRFGQYIYEWVDHPDDRRAIFALNFDREDFGVRHTDTPFRRSGPTAVEVLPSHQRPEGVEIEARLQAKGAHAIKVRYTLPTHEKALHIDMVIDKTFNTLAEAVYIPFPLAISNPKFHLDLNGVPLEPEAEQLIGSCRDWYGIHRWAEVGNDDVSVTVVPIDSPLMQVGGITTARWAHHLNTDQATLISWALHNHWDTNFKASQGEDTLLRYRLTSTSGYDSAASSKFAMNLTVPPVIVRVPGADIGAKGTFMTVSPDDVCEVHLKRANDERGLIIQAYNLGETSQELKVKFEMLKIKEAYLTSPTETDGDALNINNGGFILHVPSRSIALARALFDE